MMTDSGSTVESKENDAQLSEKTLQSTDDWTIRGEMSNIDTYNLPVPSFIRLFVIRRIISKYINYDTDNTIDILVNTFDYNFEIKCMAFDILTRLINDGIKMYMNKWYNEKKQSDIIEIIFHKIILKQFEKDYTQLMKYRDITANNDNHYQQLLFNSNDLMSHIFQYLIWGIKFNKDLFQCSLVNSHWLYHSWNINSVYYANLQKLIYQTVYYNENDENSVTRMWQRLIHAKSIYVVGLQFNQKRQDILSRRDEIKAQLHELEEAYEKKQEECKSNNIDDELKNDSQDLAKDILSQINCKFKVGDRIRLINGKIGVVRYIGNVHFSNEGMIGIELNAPSPNASDGTINGITVFNTAPHRAYFIPLRSVSHFFESTITEGCRARLKGLKRSPQYNGKIVRIVSYFEPKQCWKVRLSKNEKPKEKTTIYKGVTRENLQLMADWISRQNSNVESLKVMPKIGDYVKTKDGKWGIVKFIAKTRLARKIETIGIELDKWDPNANDGSFRGQTYFNAESGKGYFTIIKLLIENKGNYKLINSNTPNDDVATDTQLMAEQEETSISKNISCLKKQLIQIEKIISKQQHGEYLNKSQLENKLVLKKLSSLRNFDKIKVLLNQTNMINVAILKTLKPRLTMRIKSCNLKIVCFEENYLSPLSLLSAECVGIGDLCFYRIWSNKCRKLELHTYHINNNWCQFVI